MKYKETDSRGSFVAWGIGFFYEYDANEKILDIIHARKRKPLVYFDCDQYLKHDPAGFVRLLEKTTQIKALMISNYKTVDLSETLDQSKLRTFINSAATSATRSLSLEKEAYERFCKKFAEEYELKNLEITKTYSYDTERPHYFATLETRNDNAIKAEAPEISSVLSRLSSNIVQDLVAREIGYVTRSYPHQLLTVSFKLSILSHALNQGFLPIKHVAGGQTKESNKSVTVQ